MRRCVAPLALAALALCAPAAADTLIENVDGVTLGEGNAIERFTGLLIDADGKVVARLKRGDKRPRRVDYQLDGKGRVLMPSLIDAHGHVTELGFSRLTLDLSGARSLAEAQAAIRAYAAANPDKPWILGHGWNHETWALGRFPTASELDAAVADRPVWLTRADGHSGWANSAALKLAGVSEATKDPAGGRIERLAQSARPAGVLVDAASDLVQRKVPPPRPEDYDLALREAQQELLSAGVTAIADMGTTIEDWQAFRRAGDVGALRIRIMAYAAGTDAMVLIGGPGPTPWLYDDRLRLNGVKLYIDGSLGSRSALMKQDYADAPGRGLELIGPTQLLNRMSRAAMDNFQVAIHAIGDRANAEALDAIAELAPTYKGDRRWRIEHAQVIDPADLPRFAGFGIVASMQPQHQASDRLMAEARLGQQRLAGAYAWKSVSAAGARLAFGSDVPVEPPRPFLGMAVALSRQGADGEPLGGWQPQERITREAALAAYTVGAAYAGFAERRFGSLAAGQRADFVFVDRDPMLASIADLRRIRVLETWVAGKRVFQAK